MKKRDQTENFIDNELVFTKKKTSMRKRLCQFVINQHTYTKER